MLCTVRCHTGAWQTELWNAAAKCAILRTMQGWCSWAGGMQVRQQYCRSLALSTLCQHKPATTSLISRRAAVHYHACTVPILQQGQARTSISKEHFFGALSVLLSVTTLNCVHKMNGLCFKLLINNKFFLSQWYYVFLMSSHRRTCITKKNTYILSFN